MLKYLIEKEWKQFFRNAFLPKLILVMPLTVILIMPWAANQEIKDIRLAVVDNDRSPVSQKLIAKATASGYFRLTDVSPTYSAAMNGIESGETDMILEIPSGFEKHIIGEGHDEAMISANAVNGTQGSLGAFYLTSILNDYSAELRESYGTGTDITLLPVETFDVVTRYRFNPRLDYKVFMVPALMVMLLTMLTGFLPALNIVGEKEAGTIEQLNVSPVGRMAFVAAKMIPYWTIGLFVLSLCMVLAAWVYGIFPAGSLLTIYVFAIVYIGVVSGIGLVISNYSETMQQAMFVMYFFMMVFILMSGLFTPVASMPPWAQMIAAFNPLKYFVAVMRAVYLKGSSFTELIQPFFVLCGFATVFNIWAIRSYKKNS
ncbi:ABC transporter permease [Tannerella sp.]|uniref:ABC transporter permease n=1 Tax=Tannerella sp. TaxID=2382127 RepID=UPI0026DB3708|nr:ABC transporter permease [Tannerella sp.]MDO4704422.1 ABC transporter permease [Tannerella sp.]